MVPDVGLKYLIGLLGAALTTATYRLRTDSVTVAPTTTWAMLTEAAWAGYAAQAAGTWSAPYLIGDVANISPVTYPSFGNTSGVDQTATGYALVASDGTTLIDAGPLPGLVIPSGSVRYLRHSLTDRAK